RLDISWIVEQHQRLEGSIRARPLNGTFLPTGRVESHETRMWKRTTPVRVNAAPVHIFPLVLLPLALGEVQHGPVACRLIRLHTRAANFRREQTADGQGVIANHFGIQAEARLA